jgi:demethylmenaquinone methyltransferase/2-methoxy-6-polyprenyl-1,4-benzoquinol methylase
MKEPRTKSLLSTPLLVTVILAALPLMAIFTHHLFQQHLVAEAPPPADFGSGTMFDQIASRYDFINGVLALRMDVGWRDQMVQAVKRGVVSSQQATKNPKLLDVATGTADVALRLAKQIEKSTVLGLDPSNGMLDIGRAKIHNLGMDDQVQLQWADARDLTLFAPHEDAEQLFDGATMAFGIRNVPERNVALCQIHSLLKDNAPFCILEFSEPSAEFGVLGMAARVFIRHVVPIVGGILSGKPREYLHLQNSIKDFPTPPEFARLMENLECGDQGRGHFAVEEIVQMNFGSVQLYITRAVTRETTATEDNEEL